MDGDASGDGVDEAMPGDGVDRVGCRFASGEMSALAPVLSFMSALPALVLADFILGKPARMIKTPKTTKGDESLLFL